MAAKGKQDMAGLIGRAFEVVVRNLRALFNHVKFQIWALWAVGPVFLIVYGAQLASILGSAWPVSLRGEQLKYVGVGSWISLAIIAVSALLLANVIKKISVQVGAAEFEVETVTTVTETDLEIEEEDSPDGTDGPR